LSWKFLFPNSNLSLLKKEKKKKEKKEKKEGWKRKCATHSAYCCDRSFSSLMGNKKKKKRGDGEKERGMGDGLDRRGYVRE